MAMPSIADNRRWVIEQWQYLYGRMPTANEVNYVAAWLSSPGNTRSEWMAQAEKQHVDDAIKRIYQDTLGRAPTSGELAYHRNGFRIGRITRKSLTEHLAGSTEALLRVGQESTEPTAEQEDAKALINDVLKSYGLEGLADWAWQQILDGHSETRILQDLRQTDQYKARFVGMQQRAAAGLPAISEAEYISYETSARQMMRAAGLPADFYDQPADFASFIGRDVSVSELSTRISEGFTAASQAPAEVRAELTRLYGVSEGALAAFFLDPDRALPVIQRSFQAAQVSGAALRTTYGGLSQAEAERLAALGVSEDQAQEGFGQLVQSKELFGPMVGTDENAIGREAQQSAIFAGDAEAMAQIERRIGERKSAASGAQSFALGQEGVSALGR